MGFHEEKKFFSLIVPVKLGEGNRVRQARCCLESLKTFTNPLHEIILVARGGTEEEADHVRQELGAIPHVGMWVPGEPHQATFAAAVNAACVQATGNYLCWLQPAVTVTEDWLEWLVDIYRVFDKCGITGPRVIDGVERVARGVPGQLHPNGLFEGTIEMPCALIPLWIYRTVGPLDERFRLQALADQDYALRLNHHGFFVGVSGRSIVAHRPFEGLDRRGLELYGDENDHRDAMRLYNLKWSKVAELERGGMSPMDAERAVRTGEVPA